MTKGCYTCRRRRIVCDNEFPTCRKCRDAGKECLGYQKPLVWVKGGVASRGKMMGLSFDDVASSESSCSPDSSHCQIMWPSKPGDDSGPWKSDEADGYQSIQAKITESQPPYPNSTLVLSRNSSIQSPPLFSLVDPLFQDLNKTSRFYIDICTLLFFPKVPPLWL